MQKTEKKESWNKLKRNNVLLSGGENDTNDSRVLLKQWSQKKGHNIFQALKGKQFNHKLWLGTLSFRNERKIKTFSGERKLIEFVDKQTYPLRLTEVIHETERNGWKKILEHQEGRNNRNNRNVYTQWTILLLMCFINHQSCLITETKMLIPPDIQTNEI